MPVNAELSWGVLNLSPKRGRARRLLARKPDRKSHPPRYICEGLEARILLSWSSYTAPYSISNMMLLSNGTVMAHGANQSNAWYQLNPGQPGNVPGVDQSYITNGTWGPLPSMSIGREFFPSAILPSGNAFIVGGEYASDQTRSSSAEIFNPVANVWNSAITPFVQNQSNTTPASQFGDNPLEVLSNGNVLTGGGAYNAADGAFVADTWLYNPTLNTWSRAANKLTRYDQANLPVYDSSNEESWVKLPDGSILTYDNWAGSALNQFVAERYIPSLNEWVDASNVNPTNPPEQLSTKASRIEIGAGVLLPNGNAFFVSSNNADGATAIYDPSTNQWSAGPSIPGGFTGGDLPSAVMPNGHVLIADYDTTFPAQGSTHFFEYDPTATSAPYYTKVDPIAVFPNTNYPYMLALPTGQIMMSTQSNTVYVYTPSPGPDAAGPPKVTNIATPGFNVYTLTGTQLNGTSEGASYGDDAEMSTNYPIVRLTDASGTVSYARTFNWSTTGVDTGFTPETVQFTLPPGVGPGVYRLTVIANGVDSPQIIAVLAGSGTPDSITVQGGAGSVQVFGDGSLLASYSLNGISAVVIAADASTDSVTVNGRVQGTPVVVDGGTGNCSLTINDDVASDTIGVNNSSIGYGASASSYPGDVYYTDIKTVYVNGGAGGNTIGVASTAAGVSYHLNGGAGANKLYLTPPQGLDNLATIAGPVIYAGSGNDQIDLDNQLSTDAYSYILSASTLIFTDQVTSSGQSVNYSGVSSYVVNGGSGSSLFQPLSTPGPSSVFGGAGNDTFQIGNPFFPASTAGLPTFNGEGGTNTVFVDDEALGGNIAYLIGIDGAGNSSNTVSRPGFSFASNSAQMLSLTTGYGTDTVTLADGINFPASVGVNLGPGNDTVNFGNGFDVVNLGAVTLTGGTGTDTLNMDNHLSNVGFNENYAITASSVNESWTYGARGSFTYSNFSSLQITPNAGTHIFSIASSAAGTPIAVNPNSGADTFDVAGTNGGGHSSINGNLYLNGSGTATLLVDSSNDPGGIGYILAAGVITPFGSANIYYGGVDSLTVHTGTGPDVFNVNGTNVPTTLNTGSGADVVTVAPAAQNLDAIAAPLTVNGDYTSPSALIVDDQSDPDFIFTQYYVSQTALTRVGQTYNASAQPVVNIATINYGGLSRLTLNAGTLSNTVDVQATTEPTTVNPGPGTLSVSVDQTANAEPVTIGPGMANEPVNVDTSGNAFASAVVLFAATQSIGALTIGPRGSAALTPGGGKTLTASSLALSATGKLDVADDLLKIHYGTGLDPDAAVAALISQGAIYSSTLAAGQTLGHLDYPATQTDVIGVVPTVASISPNSGPTTGSTSVVITGTGFIGATAVTFGGKAATSFTVNSPTQITAVDPAGSLGVVDVQIQTPAGTSAMSASDQFTYITPVQAPTIVGSPVINGDNPNGLAAGAQRSMVEDVVYTFSEAVTIPNANAAFTVVGAGPHPGTAPATLSATAVPGSNGTQWAVTLTGGAAGMLGSIGNGEYSITISASAVFAAANGTTQLAAARTDQFYRLFGDINGAEAVTASDSLQLKKALTAYNPAFDSNADGTVNAADNLAFKKDLTAAYFGDGFVLTI